MSEDALLDLDQFHYMAEPNLCQGEQPRTVILVHTHPANLVIRTVLRTHLPQETLRDLGMVRIFLMGIASRNQTDYGSVPVSVIKEESRTEGDIVMGNFIEHYHNLTYKHFMGLSWVTKRCKQTKFVIKMDDDIAVDVFQLEQMISYYLKDMKNSLVGLVQVDSPVVRNSSKWQVSKSEYSPNKYPDYLSGWCYIASIDAVKNLVLQSNLLPFFWIDDVFITGILAHKLGINREGINNRFSIHTSALKCCYDEDHSPYEYYCDYVASPTGGDPIVMTAALSQFKYCFKSGCRKRPSAKILDRTCVLKVNRNIRTKGVAEIEIIS